MLTAPSSESTALLLGFVGVGAMGEGMCRNLARKAGRTVYAADLDPGNLRRLEADGVLATDLAGLRRTAHIVFLCLPSIQQVEDVCLDGPDPLCGPGSTITAIVDMSTSDPKRTRALGERLATIGVRFVDAPVARSREAAHKGTLLITVGGATSDVESVRPLLDCMGSDVIHCGDLGAGQAVKIMNNLVALCNVRVLAEAMAIASAAGVDEGLLARVLQLGSADSFVLRLVGQNHLARDEFPEKLFPTTYALKDMRLALDMASSVGMQAEVASATADLMEKAIAQGYGLLYHPVVYRLLKSRAQKSE